jgi:hypothetical protein
MLYGTGRFFSISSRIRAVHAVDYHEEVTGLIVLNPFRNSSADKAPPNFLKHREGTDAP